MFLYIANGSVFLRMCQPFIGILNCNLIVTQNKMKINFDDSLVIPLFV